MASTYLTKTPSSAGNRKKFTISMWVKRVKLGVDQWLVQAGASGSEFDIRFNTDDKLRFSTWDGSNGYGMITNRVFRDTSAWYHLVFQYDTAQATDTNRNKIYVNGEQISPSDTTAYNAGKHPPQNYDNPAWNNTTEFRINDVTWTSSSPKDAVYSHIHHTDGYAYDASTFGSTDSTTGEWKINTSPSVTYGTNGFFILKDGNSVTDQSGQSNNLTVSGTLTKTEDCPSNVFATMNPLDNQNQGSTFTMGNNKIEWNTNNKSNYATMAVNKGKFYWEMKYADNSGGTDAMTGVSIADVRDPSDWVGHDANGWSYYASNGNKYTGGSGSSYGNTWTTNDIIGVAFDADTRTIWFSKNGTWQNSATISEIAAGTTTNSAWTGIGSAGDWFIPSTSGYDGNKIEYNFGNGYFGTTAISSEGTNASGIGKFEYDVPTNFTALSTKGLNE